MVGFLAALGAAFSWTFASSIWRQQTKLISSFQLNGIKNFIATVFFLPLLIFVPWNGESHLIWILLLSGVIGIAFGDTFYLSSLQILGTRRTLTIEALAPLIATLLGAIYLGESLSVRSWIGILLVSLAVVIVSLQPGLRDDSSSQDSRKNLQLEGIIFAFLSVICGVVGGLLSRIVLVDGSLLPLQTASIRLVGSLIFFLPLFFRLSKDFKPARRLVSFDIKRILLATFLGTNLGVFLQQIAFNRLPLGLAVMLLSTSPLIALFFAYGEGDRPGRSGFVASAISLLGVGLAMS